MIDALILSIIQGLTEFLPVSSSAHLFLWSVWFSSGDASLLIDVGAHLGALLAIVLYQRTLIMQMIHATFRFIRAPNQVDQQLMDVIKLIVATLPVVITGGLFANFIVEFRTPVVVGVSTLFFGLLLGLSDQKDEAIDSENAHIQTMRHAFILGCYQVLALIPGVSRSGIVVTGARFLGYSRVQSVSIAFLLAIPVLVAASLWGGWQLLSQPSVMIEKFIWVVLFSALFSYLSICFLIKWVNRLSFMPFVYYRLILGALILGVVWQFVA